jgi:pimeloyl-ACP methyl ester carboxylesterase
MKPFTALAAACLIAAFFPAPAAAQADYAREKRLADEIAPGIVVGDPVWIEPPSGRKFLAIHAPAPKAAAGVIVVHGLGLHPDWGLIGVLRTQLSEQGYTTLSVQMPVLAADAARARYPAVFPEAAQRLGAASAWLRGKGLKRVAIVSHSMGASMAHYYLSHADDARVDAWVAIGMSGEIALPRNFPTPVLDLYGERDWPAVLEGAARRITTLRAIRGSGQMQAAGADHFFTGVEGELGRQVRQFLDARLKR